MIPTHFKYHGPVAGLLPAIQQAAARLDADYDHSARLDQAAQAAARVVAAQADNAGPEELTRLRVRRDALKLTTLQHYTNNENGI